MTETLAEVLVGALGIKPKANETAEAFAERIARKAHDSEDAEWEALPEDAQRWVNSSIESIEAKQPCPPLEGVDKFMVVQETAEAPKAKKAAAKKPKAAKAAEPSDSEGKVRGPKGKFGLDDEITITADGNPFREGTKCFGWFSAIKSGMTVQEAMDAGAPRHHIRWAHTLKHITIG